jgi:peptidoglycan/LPS O-acetylase OafA/YrhL
MLTEKRSEVVDGFRGIAVLSVMLFHYLAEWSGPLGYPGAYSDWWRVGKLGVDLFFVISGFVITMTTLRSTTAVEFAAKRAARLYPAFVVASLLVFSILSIFDPLKLRVTPTDLLVNFTMIAGDLGFKYVDGVFWTLAVEVKFYVFVFLAFLLLRNRFWIGVVAMAVCAIVLGLVSRKIGDHIFIARYLGFFLIGASVWYGFTERRFIACAALGLFAAILIVLRIDDSIPAQAPAMVAYVYLTSTIGALILLLRFAPQTPFGPLAFIGRISYSLYLVHQLLGVTVIFALIHVGVPREAAIATAMSAMILLAWGVYSLVELPGQKLVMGTYRAIKSRTASRGLSLPTSPAQKP